MKHLLLTTLLLGSLSIYAENKNTKTEQTISTDEKVEILALEIEKLKAGKGVMPKVKEKGKYGLGPAASKVYEQDSGLSIGGYGEIIYRNYVKKDESGSTKGSKTNQIDALRGVLYFGYKFNDNFLLNTEVEFEHVNEVSLEFAYLDYLLSDYLNFRAGLMLVPMGIISEKHEPTVFLGSNRPYTDTYIMPSTWREIGAGIFGNLIDFDYKLMLVNGFDAFGTKGAGGIAKGFDSAANGLRKGRQKGAKSSSETFAGVLQVNYKRWANFAPGFSAYYGSGAQETNVKNMIGIYEAHIDTTFSGVYFRALGSYSTIGNVNAINAKMGNTLNGKALGSEMFGAYLELGYNIFETVNTEKQLILFTRLEQVNTQAKMSYGDVRNPQYNKRFLTLGLSYKPIMNIVVKADFEQEFNEAQNGFGSFNTSLGYIF